MKKIFFILIIFTTLFTTNNFAMLLDMKDIFYMHDIKYQQMFFYNIEVPLKISEFKMFLNFKNFVAAKAALKALDEAFKKDAYDTQNDGLKNV